MNDNVWKHLQNFCGGIEPISEPWRAQARARLDTLTKPLGSLGRLEDVAAQFVAIRREQWNLPVRKGVYIFAGDHGVTAEGVSAYPSEVTPQMVLNFVAKGAAVNALAKLHGAELTVIDVGVAFDFEGIDGVMHRKIAMGTRNLRREPAMSEAECLQALQVGSDMADSAAAAGQNLIAIGEMGIGNTTAASAIACAVTGVAADRVTGRGTGIVSEMHAHKVAVVAESVALHFADSSARLAFDVLRCVGGLEIAAMAGMMLRAATHRMVLVLDGFIATAAALIAVEMAPAAKGYMIAGHRSEEPGHQVLLEHLGLQPLLALDMRLGEGTGALLAMPLIESAVALYAGMATFGSAGVSEASA